MKSAHELFESLNIVGAFPPADINSDAVGDWVSLKNYHGILIVFHKAAGTAGDDPSIILEQATDVAGTGAKALNFDHIYAKVGTQTGVEQFTKYTFTATNDLDLVSVGGTDLVADDVEALIVVPIEAAQLDVANGFDCLRWSSEGDDIGNATRAASIYILGPARFPQKIPLTAITD